MRRLCLRVQRRSARTMRPAHIGRPALIRRHQPLCGPRQRSRRRGVARGLRRRLCRADSAHERRGRKEPLGVRWPFLAPLQQIRHTGAAAQLHVLRPLRAPADLGRR
eukprot:scaffold79350_cov51-Phaeocystis_antarctica.AAC.1